MAIVCGGISFAEASLSSWEKASFHEEQIPKALSELREKLQLREAVLVSTCNRVEYFGFSENPSQSAEGWIPFLREFHGLRPDFNPASFHLSGMDSVEHLYQLAAGLKSMVIGETEILGQIKAAYFLAQQHLHTGKWTNRLFQSSFAAAKQVRTETRITKGGVSVSAVAVELAEKIFGDLSNSSVLILGAGDTGEKTARSLRSRGAKNIFVANRTLSRAQALADELSGHAVDWDNWHENIATVDVIVSSTSAPHYVLTKEQLLSKYKVRNGKPLFLIDLAVPRDFEPSINQVDDVYLYDIDNLQSIAHHHLSERKTELVRGVEILKPHISKYCSWASAQPEPLFL